MEEQDHQEDYLTPYEVAKEIGVIHSYTANPVLNNYFLAPRIADIEDTERATNAFRSAHTLTKIYKNFEKEKTKGETSAVTAMFPKLLKVAGYGEKMHPLQQDMWQPRPFQDILDAEAFDADAYFANCEEE